MLAVDVMVNDRKVGDIVAVQIASDADRPGDFGQAQMRRYKVTVTGDEEFGEFRYFEVAHDRRYGWQGLLHAITMELLPNIVETISENEVGGQLPIDHHR